MAYIGMGGNMPSVAGEPEATLAAALDCLHSLGTVVARSRLYRTAPVGHITQPHFINAIAALRTALGPCGLLEGLLQIEERFGRDRTKSFRFGPRTLDLDIVLYGDAVMEVAGLVLPHPRMHEREFVLRPLAELAPSLVEPRSGRTMGKLLETVSLPSHGPISSSGHTPGIPGSAVVPMESEFWRSGPLDADASVLQPQAN